jgi:hypothetical protein
LPHRATWQQFAHPSHQLLFHVIILPSRSCQHARYLQSDLAI